MNDSFMEAAHIFAAGNTRPSMSGNRADGKICTARPGECRAVGPHYTGSLRDNQSWTLPYSGNHCYESCCSLERRRAGQEKKTKNNKKKC